tara:strand:+ start:410 stop:574 length:165 start_codon:yes stop_codon:yes gene_type:complete
MQVMILNGERYLINTQTHDGGDQQCDHLLKQFPDNVEIDWDEVKSSDFTSKIRL